MNLNIALILYALSSFMVISCNNVTLSHLPLPPSNNSASKIAQKEYLYIGAPGYRKNLTNGPGTVYKCDLSNMNCIAITHSNVTLPTDAAFGKSIFVAKSNLYIGAPGFDYPDGDGNDEPGSVYKCNSSGTSCELINFTGVSYVDEMNFGASLYFDNSSNKIYIGADGIGNDTSFSGVVFSCDATNFSCTAVGHGTVPLIPGEEEKYGSAISLIGQNLFVGSMKYGSPYMGGGNVFKCNLSGSSCTSADSDLSTKIATHSSFGSSLSATDTHLYVGAVGSPAVTGSVYKCDLNGENCVKLTNNGITVNNFDIFGKSIFASSKHLYIGAPGTDTNKGAVYKCDLNGENCAKLNFTGLNLQNNDSFGTSLFYSSES